MVMDCGHVDAAPTGASPALSTFPSISFASFALLFFFLLPVTCHFRIHHGRSIVSNRITRTYRPNARWLSPTHRQHLRAETNQCRQRYAYTGANLAYQVIDQATPTKQYSLRWFDTVGRWLPRTASDSYRKKTLRVLKRPEVSTRFHRDRFISVYFRILVLYCFYYLYFLQLFCSSFNSLYIILLLNASMQVLQWRKRLFTNLSRLVDWSFWFFIVILLTVYC